MTNEVRIDNRNESAVIAGPLHRIAAVRHGEKKVSSSFDRLVFNRGDEWVHEGHVRIGGEGLGDASRE